MAIRRNKPFYLAVLPGKQWFYRASVLMMVTFAAALLVMGRAGNPGVVKLKSGLADIVTPALAVAASPFDAMASFGTWLSEMSSLRAENIALRNQNIQLLQWQSIAKNMEGENESLRNLLHVVPEQKHAYTTVRIVSDLGGPYVHSALVNGGSDHGLHADQAVINERGLIGRVIDAGKNSARVLLLNDINSRVPVIAENTREKSILVGSNDDLPSLSYLSAGSKIEVGERIVTSGDGGVFPEGIPVGIVTSIESGSVKVQPFVDPAKVEFVSTVD